MRFLLLAAAFFPAASALGAEAKPAGEGAPKPQRRYSELKSGVYEASIRGMVCAACAGAIEEEARKLDAVEAAEVDFDRRVLRVTVKPKRSLSLNLLKRALSRAARRIDLGNGYHIGELKYVP